jgi:excisionase family DNA binding protein
MNDTEKPPRITWNTEEAARAIGITGRHLKGLIAKGQGPAMVRLGRRVLFRPETIKKWLLEREAA